MMKTILFSLATLAALVSTQSLAADATKGAELLKKNNCASCHGDNYAKSTDDSIPSLAGQHQDYLVQALKQYRAGDSKTNPLARNNALMTGQAKKLTDADINNISAHLAKLPGILSVKK